MSLLSVQNLRLAINGEVILHDIDLSVDSGKILGIVGESGSGKSMTAYSIMRLLPKASVLQGVVSLNGVALTSMTEEMLCRVRGKDIGMIFQEPMTALNPLQCIGDQVAETVRIHTSISRRRAHDIALDTLAKVELPPNEFPPSRYPHELSGGQKQRVVIAMAIALRPQLLIADEPTTSLDVTTQAQLLTLLKRLVVEDGTGLILISHDLAVISDTADHIAVMKAGRVLEYGETGKIISDTQHPYTAELMRASDHVPDKIDKQQYACSGTPLLEVRGVVREYRIPRKKFGDQARYFRAVDDVSFTINRGENVGLVGESGCGKSTLTRAILGLDPVQAGSILLDGKPVIAGTSMPVAQRRKMQVVFQDPYGSFNPRHKVGRLVAEPLHLLNDSVSRGPVDKRVHEALRRVGLLPADAGKFIHEFSGGQRQRIAIARALINRPALIILDEAVSALDVSIRAQILDLLAEVSADFEIAYLFISHDLSVVRSVTDRVMVMRDGKLVEVGKTELVFQFPAHDYTKSLLDAAPQMPETAA